MDVTSLLNASSAAHLQRRDSTSRASTPSVTSETTANSTAVATPSPERTPPRRTSGSRSPTRNRTPWDAGGYSLPLSLDTKTLQTGNARPAFYNNESPFETLTTTSPKSPKHKLSDSRSSLSSFYSSSNNSVSHSRISSLSTVSEFQPLSSLMAELPPLETKIAHKSDALSKYPIMGDVQPPSPTPVKLTHADAMSAKASSGEPSPREDGRPRSPSDAVMIKRGSVSSSISSLDSPPTHNSLLQADSSFTKSHKRAVSAPDFPALSAVSLPSFGQIPERPHTIPQSDESSNSIVLDGTLKCMFVDNCETGSQLRKAISHIFGRNKLCTRLIPQHVWVHFCRKHYQRSRYRNAQEYAKLQCELVQKQVERVQAWSDENKRANRAGVVENWSLSVRKREQKRLEDKNMASKKRPYRDDSDDDDDDFGGRGPANGTAVPKWLLERCNSGYSTDEIKEVVAKLKLEMDEGNLTQIPDIEILPSITTDPTDEANKASKSYHKRKTSTASTHKRSQSMGVAAMRPEATFGTMAGYHMGPRPSFWGAEDFQIEKRQRVDDFYHRDLPLRTLDRTVPTMRRMGQLPHRPAFGNIRENHTEDRFYEERQRPALAPPSLSSGPFGYAPPPLASMGPLGPLPAPTPRRMSGGLAQQLEITSGPSSTYAPDARRPGGHQRSFSDVAAFHQAPAMAFRPSSSSGYAHAPAAPSSYGYDSPAAATPSYTTEYREGPAGYYDELPTARPAQQHLGAQYQPAAPRHVRHQSTPVVPRATQLFRTSSGSGMPLAQQQYDQHYRRQSYASVPGVGRVPEEGARDLYHR